MINKKYFLLIGLISILTKCTFNEHQVGKFVSTKNNNDTLILIENGAYIRKVKLGDSAIIDKGTWYYADNRLWFSKWMNRGELNDNFREGEPKLVAFSFEKSFFGRILEIYFDVDNYYYYNRVK